MTWEHVISCVLLQTADPDGFGFLCSSSQRHWFADSAKDARLYSSNNTNTTLLAIIFRYSSTDFMVTSGRNHVRFTIDPSSYVDDVGLWLENRVVHGVGGGFHSPGAPLPWHCAEFNAIEGQGWVRDEISSQWAHAKHDARDTDGIYCYHKAEGQQDNRLAHRILVRHEDRLWINSWYTYLVPVSAVVIYGTKW